MGQSPPCGDNIRSPSQEITCFYEPPPPKDHYRFHKRMPLVPIQSQKRPVHTLLPHFPTIQFNIISILRCLGRSRASVKSPRPCVTFRKKLVFYGEELIAPRTNPKLEAHPLSAACNCLFNIFAATLHVWKPSPLSAARGRAMPW
jgi:hypothetical protein